MILIYLCALCLDFINIPGGVSFEDKLVALETELEEVSKRKLEEFLDKTSRGICKKFKSSTRSIFADCWQNCSIEFWSDVERQFMDRIVEALNEFDSICESFSKSELLSAAKFGLENELVSIYRENSLSETSKSNMCLRFTKIMDRNFRFDLSGRPRHWESLLMIDDAFDKSITKAIIH